MTQGAPMARYLDLEVARTNFAGLTFPLWVVTSRYDVWQSSYAYLTSVTTKRSPCITPQKCVHSLKRTLEMQYNEKCYHCLVAPEFMVGDLSQKVIYKQRLIY